VAAKRVLDAGITPEERTTFLPNWLHASTTSAKAQVGEALFQSKEIINIFDTADLGLPPPGYSIPSA
jgi:hypothetical protein